MRQGHQNNQNNRRGRGRGGGQPSNLGGGNGGGGGGRKGGHNPLTRTFESNGPDVKIRGTAMQIADKYTNLARDAMSSGDLVMSENYLQHAEHYIRIILAAQTAVQSENGNNQPMRPRRPDFEAQPGGNDGPLGERGDDAGDGQGEEPINELPTFLQPPNSQGRFQDQPRFNNGEGRNARESRFRERQPFDRQNQRRNDQDRQGYDRGNQDRGNQERGHQDRGNPDRSHQARHDQGRPEQSRQEFGRQDQNGHDQNRFEPERSYDPAPVRSVDPDMDPRVAQVTDFTENQAVEGRPLSADRPSVVEPSERDRNPRRRRRPEPAVGGVPERRYPRRDPDQPEGEAIVTHRDFDAGVHQPDVGPAIGGELPKEIVD